MKKLCQLLVMPLLIAEYIVWACIESGTFSFWAGFVLMLLGIGALWVTMFYAGWLIVKPTRRISR